IVRAIAAVVDYHEGDWQCELRGTPQSLDGVHGRSVAQQRDHPAVGAGEGDTDRRRETVTESAARTRIKGVGLEHRKVMVHRCAAARRFLDDDASRGPERCDL